MALTAAEVWRDYVTDGVPPSGEYNPKKSEIRSWGSSLELMLNAGGLGGAVWKATKALLTSDLAHAPDTLAVVYEDATSANNGLYIKNGVSGAGSWSQITTFLPGYQFVTATDDGGSTANAYTMDTNPRLPFGDGVALVEFVVPATNTSSTVTVSFDGDDSLTIRTASGNAPVAGGLIEGMPVSGVKIGSNFYMRSDQASAAVQTAAENAASEAVAWAEGTEPGGFGTKSAKEWAQIAAGAAFGMIPITGTGDGVATTLSLPIAPGPSDNVVVSIGGVVQQPEAAFSVSGATLTWAEAPPDGLPIFGFIITATEVSVGVPDPGSVGSSQINASQAAGIRTVLDVYSKGQVDALAGTVPDGSVTEPKLSPAVAAKLNSSIALIAPIAAASQTQINFNDAIGAGAKRVQIGFDELSTNGTGNLAIILGDAGGYEVAGYSSAVVNAGTGTAGGAGSFIVANSVVATSRFSGVVTLLRVSGTNKWIFSGSLVDTNGNTSRVFGGVKTLSDALTSIRVQSGSGLDQFDNGSLSLAVEY